MPRVSKDFRDFNKIVHGFLFVFDLSDLDTLESALRYASEIQEKEKEFMKNNLKFYTKKMLVGCKKDLQSV